MTREQALPYVSFLVDDALAERRREEMPTGKKVKLVGWQCGFEPLFVAVWSYLDVDLTDDEAEEIAADLLEEKKWFSFSSEKRPPADYVL